MVNPHNEINCATVDQRREAINQVIYSERDRLILTRRLIDGWGYKDIEAEAHLERRQVSRILAAGKEAIGVYLAQKRRWRFFQ